MAVEQRKVSWPAGRESRNVSHRGAETAEGAGIAAKDRKDRTGDADRRGSEGAERSFDRISRIDGIAAWEILTNEMRRYEYAIGPSGGITYGAPAGYHDDCVMALALANHRRWETESCGRMLAFAYDDRRRTALSRRRERCLSG